MANRFTDSSLNDSFKIGGASSFDPKWWSGEPVSTGLGKNRKRKLKDSIIQRPNRTEVFEDKLRLKILKLGITGLISSHFFPLIHNNNNNN